MIIICVVVKVEGKWAGDNLNSLLSKIRTLDMDGLFEAAINVAFAAFLW